MVDASPTTAPAAASPRVSAARRCVAWTTHQPFPTYAIVGPADAAEIHESVVALEVELTPDEARWVDEG